MASKDAEVNADAPPAAEAAQRYDLKWGIYLDLTYIKSLHGILVASFTGLSLIAAICEGAGRTGNTLCVWDSLGAYDFFGFVSGSAFLTGLFNYVMYMFVFYDRLIFKFVPWNIFWLIWCVVWGVLYFIADCVIAANHCYQPGNAAAAVLGFIALIIIGVLGFLSFKKWRGERPEGSGTGPQSSASSPDHSVERSMEQY